MRILLADDHKIMREGLRTLIEKQPDMKVVAEAENGRTAVQLAQKLFPEVVVMDIGMPDLNGIEATRQILANNPKVKVIALSMHSAKRFVVEMLKAGSSGYLLKDCAFEELTLAIRTVIANKVYVSPGITDMMIKDYVYNLSKTEFSVTSILTPREREVLQLLAEGKTTKQIALSLNVSVKTIETYRQQLMHKLNLHSVAELTKYAIREGITSLEP
jgi:DNA-binding NarL/FixJ family response regulator